MTDDALDHSLMEKGKYSQLTADEVSNKDPSYLVLAYENWNPKPCSFLLYKACRDEVLEALTQGRVQRDQECEG